ncbi:MAG: O-antigen ligase family protein [Caldilineales bacterium]|nr:O-antigen ligase family protein [Caldilineales bacterium]
MTTRLKPPAIIPWLIVAIALGVLSQALFSGNQTYLYMGLAMIAVGVGALLLMTTWPASAILLIIIAALLTRYRWDAGPVSIRAEQTVAVLLAAIGGLRLVVGMGRIRFPKPLWFLTGWWLVGVIASLVGPAPQAGIQNSLRLAIVILTLVLIVNLVDGRERWLWAVRIFLIAGVLEALFGITARVVYEFGWNIGVQVGWNFPEPIPYGTFEEGNLFGSHVASWAIVLLAVIMRVPGARRRPVFWAGLAILLAALILSLSRGAWLTFALGASLLWILQTPSSGKRLFRLLLLALALPALATLIVGTAFLLPEHSAFAIRIKTFLDLGNDYTFSARLSDWSLAVQDWLHKPIIGSGPGSFAVLHGNIRYHPAWIGNLSLRLLQETGVLGAILFLSYLISLFASSLRALRRPLAELNRGLMVGLLVSYAALIGFAYQSTDGSWLTASWIHAGLIIAGVRALSVVANQPPNTNALPELSPAPTSL